MRTIWIADGPMPPGPDSSVEDKAQRRIAELAALATAWQRDLEQKAGAARTKCPPAVEQWVALHVKALRRIEAEPPGDALAKTGRMVAANTIQE